MCPEVGLPCRPRTCLRRSEIRTLSPSRLCTAGASVLRQKSSVYTRRHKLSSHRHHSQHNCTKMSLLSVYHKYTPIDIDHVIRPSCALTANYYSKILRLFFLVYICSAFRRITIIKQWLCSRFLHCNMATYNGLSIIETSDLLNHQFYFRHLAIIHTKRT